MMDKPTITATEVARALGIDVSLAKVESFVNGTKKELLHNAWSGEYTVTKRNEIVFYGSDAAEAINTYNCIDVS
jgi:hypothetical protein